MKFILFFVLPLLAICLVLHLLAKRRAKRIMEELEAEERRLYASQHINSLPIIDWEAHRKAQRARAAAQSARVEKTRSRGDDRNDSNDIMNPLHPLNPFNPIGLVNSSLSERDNEGASNIHPGGGSFGGAGSSASWEPSTCHDDSSSRHSSYGSDSGSSYSSSDSSSYSSSDSGSSSSSCD